LVVDDEAREMEGRQRESAAGATKMGRAWKVLGVVLLLLVVLQVGQLRAEFAGADERMLLIVGDVSDATARVLYEVSIPPPPQRPPVTSPRTD
jgi:hypothetical protein